MTGHITGQQARELLDGTTPGPWTATADHIMRVGWEQRERERSPWDDDDLIPWLADESEHVLMNPEPEWKPLTENRADMLLAAAAPDLAETVAWLYGREPQQSHASGGVFHCAEEEDNDLPWAVSSLPGEVSVTPTDRRDLTPDEAVDLARALLNAAVSARRHSD